MNQRFRFLSCVAALGLATGIAYAGEGPSFSFGLSGPMSNGGPEGATVPVEIRGTLSTTGLEAGSEGAQGWSVSIGIGEGCEAVGITTAGTVGAKSTDDPPGLRDGGFEKSEVVDPTLNDQGEGAVSAVVLSFTLPITLDPGEVHHILTLSLEGHVLAEEAGLGTCDVAYVSGAQGAGQPVDNKVTFGGETVVPELGSLSLEFPIILTPDVCFGDVELALRWQRESQGISEEPAGIIEPADEALTTEISGSEGDIAAGEVFVAIASNLAGGGVQGWSLSVALSAELALTEATTAGTVGARTTDDPAGLRDGGFEKTEIVDPSINDQGVGAVSAVVLSFTLPLTLQADGTATVLGLGVASAAGVPAGGTSGSMNFMDGLQGAGQPVTNVATVEGETRPFCSIASQTLTVLISELSVSESVKGDANADSRIDIGDAIWIINELFRGGDAAPCAPAGDANGDGSYDLSDATFLINYLFFGDTAPTPDGCTLDPSSTVDNCPAGATVCP